MNYQLISGSLYKGNDRQPLALIKNEFFTQERSIILTGSSDAMRTCISQNEGADSQDVRSRTYVFTDASGNVLMKALPQYAEGEDPKIHGWPVMRMPKADHALVTLQNETFLLRMQSSTLYLLSAQTGRQLVRISHRGVAGGWDISASESMRPEYICALFVFCRYLEEENEFSIV